MQWLTRSTRDSSKPRLRPKINCTPGILFGLFLHHFRNVQEDMQAGVQKIGDHYHPGGPPTHALLKGFREMGPQAGHETNLHQRVTEFLFQSFGHTGHGLSSFRDPAAVTQQNNGFHNLPLAYYRSMNNNIFGSNSKFEARNPKQIIGPGKEEVYPSLASLNARVQRA